jgi:RNA polymerase sigma factor (sigma-70 family)
VKLQNQRQEVIILDDNEIVNLFFSRSESAINETSRKFDKYCSKIAMNILDNHEDADECVNDAYLNLWNRIPPERPVMFSAFLGRIVRNLSINKYKANKTKKRGGNEIFLLLSELEECIHSGSTVESEYDAKVVSQTINSFLKTIDSKVRIIFVRRYWYADSITDISSCFQMSESKVKSMLFRTRNKLHAYLIKEGVAL